MNTSSDLQSRPPRRPDPSRRDIDLLRIERGLALLAALLLGAGLIFWVAANWQEQTRQFKYHLLQAAVLLPALGGALFPRVRTPALLLGILALGGLLAFLGQTYQTGADPWQLFAAWAALCLLWVLFAGHDAIWALWLLIAGAGLALWSGGRLFAPWHTLLHNRHAYEPIATSLAWLALLAVPVVLSRWRLLVSRRPTATLSLRLAALMAVSAWSGYALWHLFSDQGSWIYLFNLALIFAAGATAWHSRPRDFVVLAIVVLALNIVILTLVFKQLLEGNKNDWVTLFLLFTLISAGAIGSSSVWLYRQQQNAQENRYGD